ncbi:hypothetical protein [Pseudanabaena yagii]|uniref:Uncharacterized protein n=1 Tax=Pseudanabaena yagii GIHE-NHR1 TaxID=2722753 RepID=A0ABX1LP66_9CYAN|nr:hypothetical protein [Pseudanabaena yagii]NMF57103.1 hypothetical protein [Pseudanabaena yagii GIHE-NHR1]NMF57882.1 hypothetical protein [Pseudanabaena yagii GIHE-NHR1]
MDTKLTEKQFKTNRLILLGAGASTAGGAITLFGEPSNAQSTASTAITQMNTDAAAIGTLVGVIQPIAVAAVVFAAAALLFKRYLYS